MEEIVFFNEPLGGKAQNREREERDVQGNARFFFLFNLCHNKGWGDLKFDIEIDPLVRDLRRRYDACHWNKDTVFCAAYIEISSKITSVSVSVSPFIIRGLRSAIFVLNMFQHVLISVT